MSESLAMASEGEASAHEDDPVLVRRALEDCLAFAELYRRYYGRVFQYLRLRTPTNEDAADLTHSVFLKALDSLSRFQDRGTPFAAWLFRIARNAAIDAARKRRNTVALDLVPEAEMSEEDTNPEVATLEGESLRRLRELIAGLDKEKREMLALRFAAGLSSREIGLVVQKSEAAVKKQIGRTLGYLKDQCKEHKDAEAI